MMCLAHLKDSHYSGAAKLGRGLDYKYPHAYGGICDTAVFTGRSVSGKVLEYYHPTENGSEACIQKILRRTGANR